MIYHGDCLDVMATLPDRSVDLILCDLPYGTTRNAWDSVIPFPDLWAAYRRIARGAVVLTAAQPFTSALVMSNPAWFKYDWTWRKVGPGTGFLNAKKQPLRNKEDVLVFYESQPVYNPQFTEGAAYSSASKNGKGSRTANYDSFGTTRDNNPGRRCPVQVLDITMQRIGTVHPTQKPVELMEYMIRTYTNPGMTVLDNCMGSGTTGVACFNTGRRFIGIERDAGYFTIAEQRLAAAQAELAGLCT